MIQKNFSFSLLFLCFSSLGIISHAQERIIDFHSDIEVLSDATMRVHETIVIALAEGKRGLYRDFPTDYVDRYTIKHVVNFAIEKITLHNNTVPYEIIVLENGKRIRIGDPNRPLSGGIYTYDLFYTTNRQLGFFEKHDELYWNVTGNGWYMPIEHASARVKLPSGIASDKISVEGYAGFKREKGAAYRARIIGESKAEWNTTAPLMPAQGLTLVITWPKGHVAAPTLFTQLYYFLKDNLGFVWLLFGMLFFVLYCIYSWLRFKKEQISGTIIPLFYPPKDYGPAHVRYLSRFGYDNKAFAAEIINMAVHGFITIESKGNFFTGVYTLHQNEQSAHEYSPYYKKLANMLFPEEKQLVLNQRNTYIVHPAVEYVTSHLSISLDRFFNYYSLQLMAACSIAITSFAGFLFFGHQQIELLFLPLVFFAVSLIIFYYTLRGYTQEGRKLYEDIEGFKLFLSTAESERMKIIGTPPTRTPELYEKYLPYAVALGVEEQWSTQFASIFDKLMQQGTPYTPLWYVGPFNYRHSNMFASELGKSLTNSVATSSVISSSDNAPGSSSGSGGGGSSGGGGGGGGGGSW